MCRRVFGTHVRIYAIRLMKIDWDLDILICNELLTNIKHISFNKLFILAMAKESKKRWI